jgi:hypothetical protein
VSTETTASRQTLQDSFQHRQQARLLFFALTAASELRSRTARARSGPRALCTQIDNVRAFLDQLDRVRDSFFGKREKARRR